MAGAGRMNSPSDKEVQQILEKMRSIAAGAERRAGQVPPRIDPVQTRALHRQAYASAKSEKEKPNGYVARQTFCGELHCSKTPLNKLSRMNIGELRMEITHTGRYLLCRIVEPCFKMSGIMTVVEDTEGAISILSVYNYTRLESTDVEKLLPVGTILAIKEPYYKFSNTNSCVIRCDSPSDVVVLQTHGKDNGLNPENVEMAAKILKSIRWKGKLNVPAGFEAAAPDDYKGMELKAIKEQCYHDAVEIATRIIRHLGEEDDRVVHVFPLRAFAFASLGLYERSFKDVIWSLERFPQDYAALMLAAQNLYALRRYSDSEKLFNAIARCVPPTEQFNREFWIGNCRKRLAEEREGRYAFGEMAAEASHLKEPRLECADYVGPVKLVPLSAGGKYKMVLTKEVAPGTLLLASKAFEIVFADAELPDAASGFMLINFKRGIVSMPSHSQLTTKIALKLLENPSLAAGLYDLPLVDGPVDPAEMKLYADDVDQREPVANVGLIHRIVSHNAVSPVILDENALSVDCSKSSDTDAGLWILPSHIRHACCSSATITFIGDFCFIRSKQHLKPGDEITIPRIQSVASYADRSAALSQKGISCYCDLCDADCSEPKGLAAKREKILEDFGRKFKLGNEIDMNVALATVTAMKETYKNSAYPFRPLLYLPYTALGACHLSHNNPLLAAQSFELALSALGFTPAHEEYLLQGGTLFPRHLLLPLAPMTAIHCYNYYWHAGEYERAERWYRIARGLDKILHGGDEAIFKRLYHSFLNIN